MCGIAGKISLNPDVPVSESSLKKMVQAIKHRGPDSNGVNAWNHVGFAHARLAILDLTPSGHQPMSYDRGNLWITFNGEVYNFQEIRKKLQAKGYRFHSKTDTEVMLAAYQEYGEKCVQHFRGMFAFAIYDKKKQVIFAARDRMGQKPFKYYFDGETFLFASELKAILTQLRKKPRADVEALKNYVYWGFVPAPKTGFEGIFKLPAAHTLTLNITKRTLKIKKYWESLLVHNTDRSLEDTQKELRETLEKAVELQMISDVPLGAFLSGGIDSGIIVGLMSQLNSEPVRTFTIGVEGWSQDERADARITAQYHKTQHREESISADIQSLLPQIVYSYEEPFGDASALPSFAVSKLAHQDVTVILNGDGGDENFLGYSNYETFLFTQKHQYLKFPASLAYSLLSPWKSQLAHSPIGVRALRVSDILRETPARAYRKYARGYMNLIELPDLFLDKDSKVLFPDALFSQKASDAVSQIMHQDQINVLPDGLLAKIDIASMQYGLEGRSPFLDHKVVELASSIPTHMKYSHGVTKSILRNTFADLLPQEVIGLPKRGFVVPINDWMQNELHDEFQLSLFSDSSPIFEFLNKSTVAQMFQWHLSGVADYSPFLWRIFMLAQWYKTFKVSHV